MSKLLLLGLFLTLCPLSVLAEISMEKGAPIKVGVFVPLTGPGAAWGMDVKNILTFANRKLAKSTFQFVLQDDRCSPKYAVTAAHKLVNLDRVQYAFGVCVGSVVASAPIFEKAQTLVMAVLVTSPAASASDYVFRSSISNQEGAQRLFDYVSKGHGKLGILSEDNDYSTSMLNHFLQSASKSSLEIEVETFTESTTDFRSTLLKLRGKNIDSLFINSNLEPTFLNILKQTRDLNLSWPIFGAYLPGATSFLKSAGSLAEGIVFVDFPPTDALLTIEGKKLFDEYVAEFGYPQSSDFSFPVVFEAFRAVSEASGHRDPLKFLRTAKFKGIFGSYHFDSRGDIVGLKNAMKVIRGGRPTAIDD